MQITLTLPDNLSLPNIQRQLNLFQNRWQQELRISFPQLPVTTIDSQDPWCNPGIDLPSVDTGVADLALNHDHYLYGTPPQK